MGQGCSIQKNGRCGVKLLAVHWTAMLFCGCFSFFAREWHNGFMGTYRTPLADRIRPQTLAEFVGQRHLVAKGKILHGIIASDHITSMILWGRSEEHTSELH